eukprot:SAG22_NODE_341_length_11992_cov_180.308753_5_plen_42_part_00
MFVQNARAKARTESEKLMDTRSHREHVLHCNAFSYLIVCNE